jgi:hypothetical protein
MKPREFLENKEFIQTVHQSLMQTLLLLFKNDTPFKIVANISRVSFDPKLPASFMQDFKNLTVFLLENYTFSSAKLTNDCLIFDAGFDDGKYVSSVTVPIGAIVQIAIENTPVIVNLSIDTDKPTSNREERSKESLEALLSNPENQKLVKK